MAHKVFYKMALVSLILSSVSVVYAASTTADNMTCQEFLDVTPSAQSPVLLWVTTDDTINSNGGSFKKTTVDATVLPQVVELCKKNPEKKVSSFKQEIKNLFNKM